MRSPRLPNAPAVLSCLLTAVLLAGCKPPPRDPPRPSTTASAPLPQTSNATPSTPGVGRGP